MSEEKVILEAKFNPKVRNYWLLSGTIVFTLTIVGIPLLLLWIPLGLALTGRYLESLTCVLTDRNLKVGRGIFNRVEKTVPLDKITDLGMTQGPIMRYMDLEAMSVETAGQSAAGALINLVGIIDGRKFREAVLKQRDKVTARNVEKSESSEKSSDMADMRSIFIEIRDSLKNIETALAKDQK